ncbi:MAG: hypothetical protein D6796_13960 [Caldilineae bacterium]|nr:MAG: hypothetical protein D6796_13960 [Caldilineae bacterium]
MKRLWKWIAVTGLVVLGIALALGAAQAQGPDTPPPPKPPAAAKVAPLQELADVLGMPVADLRAALREGRTIEEIAAEQGMTMADLADALYNRAAERIEAAVAEGRLSRTRADRMLEALKTRHDACVNEGDCRPPRPPRPPRRPRLKAKVRAMGRIVADTLGMSGRELLDALRAGQTLEEIAAQQGVTMDAIADALYNAAVEQLDRAVENGRLTPERADRIRPRLEQRRDACANEGRCLPLPPPCREPGTPGN